MEIIQNFLTVIILISFGLWFVSDYDTEVDVIDDGKGGTIYVTRELFESTGSGKTEVIACESADMKANVNCPSGADRKWNLARGGSSVQWHQESWFSEAHWSCSGNYICKPTPKN